MFTRMQSRSGRCKKNKSYDNLQAVTMIAPTTTEPQSQRQKRDEQTYRGDERMRSIWYKLLECLN